MSADALFDEAFDFTIGQEGGYINDPSDSGGETNFGISKRSYPDVDIKNLTKEGAKEIYKKDYWSNWYDLLNSKDVAIRVFDMAVNSGKSAAEKTLQKAINHCGANIVEDGFIGLKTINAIFGLNKNWVLDRFRVERAKFYADCVDKSPIKLKYLKGWIFRSYR